MISSNTDEISPKRMRVVGVTFSLYALKVTPKCRGISKKEASHRCDV